jgi:hypothetical protein
MIKEWKDRKTVEAFQQVEEIVEEETETQLAGSMNIAKKVKRNSRRIRTREVVAIAIIDAETGTFKEVTWVEEAIQYLPITRREAFRLLEAEINGDETSMLTKRRSSRRSSLLADGAQVSLVRGKASLYYPTWKILYNEKEYLIDQEGNVVKNEIE